MVVEDGRLSGKEVIQRASVIDELWVLHPGSRPDVYISLLHKTSKDWWENPGGQISTTEQSESVVEASIRERDEESRTSIIPIFDQIIQIDEDPNDAIRLFATIEKRYLSGMLPELLLPLQSHLVVSRRFFHDLPDIAVGAHFDEHDNYRLLDIHGLYYPFGQLVSGTLTTFKTHLITQMTDRVVQNAPFELLSLPESPHVVSFFPHDDERIHEYESLQVSPSTIVSMWRYAMYSYKLERLLPVSATGVLMGNGDTFSVIKPNQ